MSQCIWLVLSVPGRSIESSLEVLTLESCSAAGASGALRSSMRRQQFSCYSSIYLHDSIKAMDVHCTLYRPWSEFSIS